MYLRATVVLGLLLGVSGCASKMGGASYESYAAYDDYDADSVVDEIDADYGESERMMMREEAAPAKARRKRGRRADRDAPSVAGAAAPASPSEAAPDPEPAAEGGGEQVATDASEDDPKDHGRHIIYTATMQVAVFNLEDAMKRAETLPDKYGGFVQNMSANYFVMRIPAAKLRTAMDELAGLGIVENRTLDAQDVTEEYLDIETRISVLEATQKQMMDLLTKARTVEEALKVRQALDQITMELEVLKGRLRRLGDLISFSTLTINLIERGPHNSTPTSNDPFGWVNSLGVEATEWK